MKTRPQPTMRQRMSLPFASAFVLLGIPAANAAYPDMILTNNPVAYYRLEEVSGTTAFDSSPNHFDGIYTPNSGYPQSGFPGIETNSVLFHRSGPPGFISIPYREELNPKAANGTNGAAFSAECWVQPLAKDSGPNDYSVPLSMFGGYGAPFPGGSGWNFYQQPGANNNNWVLNFKNAAFIGSAITITPLQWYHLAVTFDGSTVVFYVNGVSQGSSAAAAWLPNPSRDGQIAAGDAVGFLPFTGGVDEVAFYTNALNAAQILSHYQVGTNSFSTRSFPPLVLDDPASTTVDSGSAAKFTVVADGATPLSYQWVRGSSPILNATNNPYSFVTVPGDNGASFSVVLSNAFGSVTSAVASLTVSGSLTISNNPFSITRQAGSNSMAAFRVVAGGAQPISYQWFKVAGGVTNLIAGATSDTLWLSGLQLADNGSYFAQVTNAPLLLSTNSEPATLTVVPRTVNVPITGYARVVVADKPVAYWRLDEPDASTTATDAVGSFDGAYQANAGAFTFGTTNGIPNETNAAVGIAGGAVVSIPYALELNPYGNWSAETWIKPSSLGTDGGDYRVVFSSQWNLFPNPYHGWYVYQQPNHTFALAPQPGNFFIGAGPNDPANANLIVANKWYHLVITDDGVLFRVYVNGEQRGSLSRATAGFIPNGVNGDPSIQAGAAVLGRRTDGAFNPFLGTIDETAFYNYALSPAQIQLHYLNSTKLTITKSGNNVILSWPVGTLQSAPAASGTYTNVPGATSPLTNAASATQKYYRVQLQP